MRALIVYEKRIAFLLHHGRQRKQAKSPLCSPAFRWFKCRLLWWCSFQSYIFIWKINKL